MRARDGFDTRILAKLARQHPRLTVEVSADEGPVDIVAQGFDAGIRIHRAIQQDMVTTRLTGSFKVILVASRDYLDARGTPKSIADLASTQLYWNPQLSSPVRFSTGN